MNLRLILFALVLMAPLATQAAPTLPLHPRDVVVLYNASRDDSRELAVYYAVARDIPRENVVGLEMPGDDQISRAQFNQSILEPLREAFSERGWWRIGEDRAGNRLVVQTNKRVIAIIRGVPRRVSRQQEGPAQGQQDEASVDSELAAIGLIEAPVAGALRNPYYQEDASFLTQQLAPIFLVGRLDAPGPGMVRRMIDESVTTEQPGLWGHAYIDQDDQYPEGSAWIAAVATQCSAWGLPVVAEPTTHTFPTHYPMEHAALYYGWYDHQWSGALRNPDFRFRPGAVAVHIHSFSARSLQADRDWCGPILARGAAATLGNVAEPYLGMTHHLDLFNERLLQGYSLAEASQMSVPVLSWMWTLLGDPLYRPFAAPAELSAEAELPADAPNRPWKELRQLALRYPDFGQRLTPLRQLAAERDHEIYWETLASIEAGRGQDGLPAAIEAHQNAIRSATSAQGALRNELALALIAQISSQRDQALQRLLQLDQQYAEIPEGRAARAMAERLQPPSPPSVLQQPPPDARPPGH